jgi:hypothetical protein
MTQGPGNRAYSASRRANRGGRAKPTLVTATTNDDISNDQLAQNGDALLAESDVAVEAQDTLSALQKAAPAVSRKLPRFFSTVGKSDKAKEVSEEEAAQARIARATRGKSATKAAATSSDVPVTTTQVETAKAKEPAPAPARARANAPARPPSPFKTKYIIGMVIYLLGAQFIGTYEKDFFVSNHMESVLTSFKLFGLPLIISTSTLAFLVTLVVLLVVLAKFDLLPRSLSALSGQPASRRGAPATQRSSNNEVYRTPQPTMKQGVSGEDDDLYREYRENQRRTRKR